MYYFAFVVLPHHYSSSMLRGALPSGKRSYDSQLGSQKSFKTLYFFSPFSLSLFYSFLVSPRLSLSSSHDLIHGEHLTDVLFKDEKHSGRESKSKQEKNIHGRMRKTLLYTHTHINAHAHMHAHRSPEDYHQRSTGHFREDSICSLPYLIQQKRTLCSQKTLFSLWEDTDPNTAV